MTIHRQIKPECRTVVSENGRSRIVNVQKIAGRLSSVIFLGALLVPLAGCNKMLANFSLNQASKRVAQARQFKADEVAKDDLVAAEEAISTTQQYINSQNFKEARAKGKDAATKAKDLLEKTKTLRATNLKSDANRWIGYADLNQARTERPATYDQMLAGNTKGQKAFEKQKWEEAIGAFDKCVSDAQFLMENLKRTAEQGLTDVNKKKEDLTKEGAPDNYPEAMTQIDEFLTRINDLITVKYDYRTAASTHDQAIQEADKGIRKTREIKSDKLLRQVETSLTRATALGAQLYVLDRYNEINNDFNDLLKLHYEGKYESVLTTGPKLVPRAEQLIVDTQRESAKAKMDAVTKAIAKLVDGQARVHLPGRVEQLEQKAADAKARFDKSEFSDSEKISLEALDEEKKIVDDFDKLAKSKIDAATQSRTQTKDVFERMEEIFAHPAPGELSGDDKALEDHKLALREELRGKLQNAELALGLANLKREDKDFNTVIETAKKVTGECEEVTQGVFKVVSHNAIQEIDNELTRYERQGGREYVAAEMDKTRKMLDGVRDLHRKSDYRGALTQAAETKAQLEVMAQEFERFAVGKIDAAKKSLALAKERRGDEYQEGRLLQVATSLRSATESLSAEKLKSAIETADQAKDIADKASAASIRQWAEEEMRRTDLILARAREAGATSYASAKMEESLNLRRNAQTLYEAGDFPEAQISGAKASAAAQDALYAIVIDAENEIASAKRFEGWRYESERLAQAIINAKYAREFLDQGSYELSRRHAKSALQTAKEVVKDSQKAAFHDRLTALNSKIEVASTKGVGYYQVKDLSKIVGDLNELAKQFTPEAYAESADKIELLEAQLAGLVEMTPDVLQKLVDQLNQNLSSLENRGAVSLVPDLMATAKEKVKFAQLDYKNEKYRPSFVNVKDAIKTINEIEVRLDERDYDLKLSQHFTQLAQSIQKFAPVLNMGSPVLLRLIHGANGRNQALALMSTSSPAKFRQDIADLAAQVNLLKPPSTRRDTQQAAVEMLDLAQTSAGGFEKLLILDQYSPEDAKKIIETAFVQMQSAQSRQQAIQRTLEHPQTQTQQVGVKRAIQLQ